MATVALSERIGLADADEADGVPFDVPPDPLTLLFPDPEEFDGFLETVQAAIEANRRSFSRLQGTGRWRSPCWEFTRLLRWVPKLRDLTAEQAAEVVGTALGILREQDKEDFPWEDILGHSDTHGAQLDPFTDFLVCWDKVSSEGAGALDLALEEVRADPREAEAFLGDRFPGAKWAGMRTFLALAYRLQTKAGEATICLAVEPLAERFGVAVQQVSRWRVLAEKYGYLELVEKPSRGRAAEFRFNPHPADGGRG